MKRFFATILILFNMLIIPSISSAAPLLLSPQPQQLTALSDKHIVCPAYYQLSGTDKLSADTVAKLTAILKQNSLQPADHAVSQRLNINFRSAVINILPTGYTLETKANNRAVNITITANDDTGFFYGIQTMRQLLQKAYLPELQITDYPTIKNRGIVEGFYGTPWTHQDRLNQLNFYGEHKLNTYIYAPKDDSYHRQKWREPYPAAELNRMKELLAAANANKVNFVFAVSPGIDIDFSPTKLPSEEKALIDKLNSLYQLGVRHFAIYFDDIKNKDAVKHAELLNTLTTRFIDKHPDTASLISVPTEYFSQDMLSQNSVKPYTERFARTLSKNITVLYTGPGVVCETIPASDIQKVNKIYQRKLGIWWNYPVNDYLTSKLALGPIYNLSPELRLYTDTFLINPMEHADLSKITLQTGADYSWNPKAYSAEASWDNAISEQYGKLAPSVKVFAEHSSRMVISWGQTGRQDAPELQQQLADFWCKHSAGQNTSAEQLLLNEEFKKINNAAITLLKELPPNELKGCKNQLALLNELSIASQTALNMITAPKTDNNTEYLTQRLKLNNQYTHIKSYKEKISEAVLLKFIEDALN